MEHVHPHEFIVIDNTTIRRVEFPNNCDDLGKVLHKELRGWITRYPAEISEYLVFCNEEAAYNRKAKFNDVGAYVLSAIGLYVISQYPLLEPIAIMKEGEKPLTPKEVDAFMWLANNVHDLLDKANAAGSELRHYFLTHAHVPDYVRKVFISKKN